jgi:hypothetical protein
MIRHQRSTRNLLTGTLLALITALLTMIAIENFSRPIHAAAPIEYKVVLTNDHEMQTILNSSSKEGWELVNLFDPHTSAQHYLILKRQN